MKKGLRQGIAAGIVVGLLLALTGTILSFGWRDRWLLPGVIYYATPWLLRLGMSVIAIGYFRKRKPLVVLCAAMAVVAAHQGWNSYARDPLPATPESGQSVKVSTWNAGRVLYHRPDLWSAAGGSDLCAIVETGPFDQTTWTRFTAATPEYTWRRLDAGTAIGVKGRILKTTEIRAVPGTLRAFRVEVALPQKPAFAVIVTDIKSTPWLARGPAYRALREAAGDDSHAVILGDFNTPAESCWADDWKSTGLALANDSGHRSGFRETWPFGIPLLTLDQIWTGAGWKAREVRHLRYGSDHAKVDVRLSDIRPKT